MTTPSPRPATVSTTATSTLGQVRGTLAQDFKITATPIGGPQFVQDPPPASLNPQTPARPMAPPREPNRWWLFPWFLGIVFLLVLIGWWQNSRGSATLSPPAPQTSTTNTAPVWPSRECGWPLQANCAIALSGGLVKLRGTSAEQEAIYRCVPQNDRTDNCELIASTSTRAPFNISITRANGRSGPITHIQHP